MRNFADDRRKTFLIGAGFSKPFGLPLANDLLAQVVLFGRRQPEIPEILTGIKFPHFEIKLEDVVKRFNPLSVPWEQVPFENLISDLFAFNEIWSFSHSVDSPVKVLKNSLLRLTTIFLDLRSRQAMTHQTAWTAAVHLMKACRQNTKFITLNYDTILEKASFVASGAANRDNKYPDDSPIFKPHGSIDVWNLKGHIPLFKGGMMHLEKFDSDTTEYYRIQQIEEWMTTTDMGKYVPNDMHPIIIPPLKTKTFSDPYIKGQLSESVKALTEADEIYILGSSLSEIDHHLLSMITFASVHHKIFNKAVAWTIVDPNAREIAERLRNRIGFAPSIFPKSWIDWINENQDEKP